MKFDDQTDAEFEDAYLNEHVTCEDDSVDNAILDGYTHTTCQINSDLMITAVTATTSKSTKHNPANLPKISPSLT